MSTSFKAIVGTSARQSSVPLGLYGTASTRHIEQHAAAQLPQHTLMQRAGLVLAQFTLAVVPHADTIWIACGPGNNGGDGLEAALHLQRWGKKICLSWLPWLPGATAPADAARAWSRAQHAGIAIHNQAPATFDAAIDALFGIGPQRPLHGAYAEWVEQMNRAAVPVIATDIPTGLDADTGQAAALHVQASHTLSLLTLKPGLFTADGRDACGDIWWHDLHVTPNQVADAWINPAPTATPRRHNSHKGSYGDVVVVGGARGMEGAALLAGSAALHAGAGRVFVTGVDVQTPLTVNPSQPELMFKPLADMVLAQQTVVAGCGGGNSMAQHVPDLLQVAAWLVLDADALNAIAHDPALQRLLSARPSNTTILTPHPLEAARLLGCTTTQIQANRLHSAKQLAQRFGCTVVLKGSGSVIAAPDRPPHINITGNAQLATGGTGDVLAGLCGTLMAQRQHAWQAACEAVYQHGLLADTWVHQYPGARLTAGRLAQL